jgi:DNA primase
MPRVDVAAIRAAHPIEDVVAASGVELRRSGKAFMARCPFHVEDRTPSMSVGGVPGRYHCFACAAGSDVIDYVARFKMALAFATRPIGWRRARRSPGGSRRRCR